MPEPNDRITRRDFIDTSKRLGAASVLGASAALSRRTCVGKSPKSGPKMPMRMLGGTGVEVSILGLGGGGRGGNPQIKGSPDNPQARDLAIQILNRGLDEGINYIDSCVGYGHSESVIGEVVAERRKEMFLATKCNKCAASGDQLRRELEQSLERLRTDRIDLWQIHNITSPQSADAIFGKDAAIEVFLKAKEEGLARFIGIAVHTSRRTIDVTLRRCQELGVQMDTLLMGFNIADRYSGGHGLQVLEDHPSIGKIAMKVFGSDKAPIVHSEGVDARTALSYVWNHGFATAIIGTHSLVELEENIRIARQFKASDEEELRRMEKLVKGESANLWTLKA